MVRILLIGLFLMTINDELIVSQFLAQWHVDTEAFRTAWVSHLKHSHYSKGQTILAAGQCANSVGLIHTGAVRYYYHTPDGKEWNKAFYSEGETVVAASAYITGQPAPFTIEALEETALLTINRESIDELFEQFPEMQQLLTQMITQAFIRNEQREAILLTHNAEQRYQWLQEHEPQWLQRIPQFHLASYIGIDAVSLSRIKRKASS